MTRREFTATVGAAVVVRASSAVAQTPPAMDQNPVRRRGVGLRGLDTAHASAGFTLFAPMLGDGTVYLIDLYGGSGKLKKIDVSGGAPQTLCDLPDTLAGGFWTRKGEIVFGTFTTGIFRAPSSGGAASALISRDPAHIPFYPVLLPDERHFIYRVSGKAEDVGIYLGSLNGNSHVSGGKKLLPDIAEAFFAPSLKPGAHDVGYLLFVREATLLSQSFDSGRGELIGDPVPIAQNISGIGAFGVSENGVLVYRAADRENRQLTWFDRAGNVLGAAAQPATDNFLNLSPDDLRAATQRLEVFGSGDIWILDLARGGIGTRFTVHPADDAAPVWSPDGKRIVWSSNREGPYNLYQKATAGGKEEVLLHSDLMRKLPFDWSSDGRYLLYGVRDKRTSADLWVLPMTGERQPFAFANTEFNETNGQFSPDMHWVPELPAPNVSECCVPTARIPSDILNARK